MLASYAPFRSNFTMATTYGAPTNLDLSACDVTATGGTDRYV